MTNVTIHGLSASSYVRTARMICYEKGIEHELRPVELGSDAHRALHPWAKMPILDHGSIRLYETTAITRYLDDTFSPGSLTPKDIAARARGEQWISVLNAYLYETFVRNYILQYIFPRGADGKPNREVIDRAVQKMAHDLDGLEKGIRHQYLAGDTLSIVDLFYAPVLYSTSLFPEGKPAIASRPNVQRYLDRITDRASFKKAQA